MTTVKYDMTTSVLSAHVATSQPQQENVAVLTEMSVTEIYNRFFWAILMSFTWFIETKLLPVRNVERAL